MEIVFELTDEKGNKIRGKELSIIGMEELRPGQPVKWMKTGPEKEFTEHIVGHIFTPGGSGHTIKNAIQICGFDEAFDLWGCAMFGGPVWKGLDKQFVQARRRNGRFSDRDRDEKIAQKKDVQLLFSMETKEHNKWSKNCYKCYNNPCTCEIQIKHDNPYTVKRSQDLYLERDKDDSIRLE
jgi:hypothetical protein